MRPPIKTREGVLREIKEYLGGIDYINSGGCGVSTLVLYKIIKELYPDTDVEICFLYEDIHTPSYRINHVKRNKIVAPNHCCIKLDGIFIDNSRGVYFFFNECVTVSYDFFISSLKNKTSWNPSFKRDKIVPAIEDRLKIDLSEAK